MKFYIVFLLIFISFLTSCKKDEINNSTKKTTIIIADDIPIKKLTKKIALHKSAKKTVENWQEYQALNEFIPKLYNSTTREVLFNSNQLQTLTQQLKDSIRIDKFKIPSFKTRLNVLHNEALRLFDMDSIPSITNKEIIQENKNILTAFNAVNIKINSLVKRELIIKDLSGFDYLFKKPKEIEKTKRNNIKKNNKIKRKRRIHPLNAKK